MLAYTRRGFLRQTVRCSVTAEGLSIAFDVRAGDFKPWWREIAVKVHGWDGAGRVSAAGKTLKSEVDVPAQTIAFTLAAPVKAMTVMVRR